MGLFRDIAAANEAVDDTYHANLAVAEGNDKEPSNMSQVIHGVTNSVGDILNYATLGTSRKIVNALSSDDKRIDYKAMKDAKKSGQITDTTSADDAAKVLRSQRTQMVLGAAADAGNNYSNRASNGATANKSNKSIDANIDALADEVKKTEQLSESIEQMGG